MRVICLSLKMKEIPISKRILILFISRSKHVQYVSLSPEGANSAGHSFDREESILYEFHCLCIPSWPLFLPTPNSRRYPRSFSNPVWATVWPLPRSACPSPSRTPMPEASLATSMSVIYLEEQHSSGAGPDQMAVISQTEAERWEAWPILWSATRSNRRWSEWINGDVETHVLCFGLLVCSGRQGSGRILGQPRHPPFQPQWRIWSD